MNTNPDATVVLCFGDSNTFGQRSDDVNKGRWPADVRWTGQMQLQLGNGYQIIEEGLSSRTTDLDYPNNSRPGRNGQAYLTPCLLSHNPIDVVILMLGTNDVKTVFKRPAEEIAAALDNLIADVAASSHTAGNQTPKIILVSPININTSAPYFAKLYAQNYDQLSAQTVGGLAKTLEQLANKRGCTFVDASAHAEPGDDGVHLSKESHLRLATVLANTVRGLA